MMKILTLFRMTVKIMLAAYFSMSTFSCTDCEEDICHTDNILQDVEVSEMSKWLSGTRNNSSVLHDMPVLHFKNQQIYYQTISKLNEMSADERNAYFKKIGFEGAYMLWKQADDELEQIFENVDTLQLEKLIGKYKIKYGHLFSFNLIDKFDVTPYLSFTDNELSLVGNIKGYVVIGEELKAPLNNTPNYDREVTVPTRAAIARDNKTNFRAFEKANLIIKCNQYSSTMTIGRMINTNLLAVYFVTKKHAALWTKRTQASYSANLFLRSIKVNCSKNKIVCPYGKEIFVLDLNVEDMGKTFDAEVIKFKCSLGQGVVSRKLYDIQVI